MNSNSEFPKRSRGSANSKDTVLVAIRLTQSENELLRRKARELGVPLSTFLRNAALMATNLPARFTAALSLRSHEYAFGGTESENSRVRSRTDAWGEVINEQGEGTDVV
jgi:hypothetical protein